MTLSVLTLDAISVYTLLPGDIVFIFPLKIAIGSASFTISFNSFVEVVYAVLLDLLTSISTISMLATTVFHLPLQLSTYSLMIAMSTGTCSASHMNSITSIIYSALSAEQNVFVMSTSLLLALHSLHQPMTPLPVLSAAYYAGLHLFQMQTLSIDFFAILSSL